MGKKFSWDNYPVHRYSDKKFNWKQYKSLGQAPSDSFDPEAAIQGAGQFASFGYLPEATGLVGRAIPDPTAELDERLRAQGTKIIQKPFRGVTTDESREMQEEMARKSPWSYYGGGTAAAFASAPLYATALERAGIVHHVPEMAKFAEKTPFLQKAKAYGSHLGQRMVESAKEGVTLGAFVNPNEKPGEEGFNLPHRVENAAVSGAFSGLIPPAADLAIGTKRVVGKGTGWLGSRVLSFMFGVKPQIIEEYAKYSQRINSAKTLKELKKISDDFVGQLKADVDAKKLKVEEAQEAYKNFNADLKDAFRTAGFDAREAVSNAKIALRDAHGTKLQQVSGDVIDYINQLKKDVQTGSAKALDTLDQSGAMVELAPTYAQIDDTIRRLEQGGTDEALALVERLKAYKERLVKEFGEFIPAVDAKNRIKAIDRITEYSSLAGSFDKEKNAAFKGIRASLDESVKNTVREYRDAMIPVNKDSDLLSRLSPFAERQAGVTNLGRIRNPNQLENLKALDELGQKYEVRLLEAADMENLPEYDTLKRLEAAHETFRSDRVARKIDDGLAHSYEKNQLENAQEKLRQSQENLSPFKALAPKEDGRTAAQEMLEKLGKGKNIELEELFTKLGKMTDTDFVQAMKDQEVLAAFQKGAYNGSRNTLMGTLMGYWFGDSVPYAVGGGALGRGVDQWGPVWTKKALDAAIWISKRPTIEAVMRLSLPEGMKKQMILGLKDSIAQGSREVRESFKSEDRWALQGVEKLGIKDENIIYSLLKNPKAKSLLIQASDMKPGSPGMRKIRDEVLKLTGDK